MATEIVITAIGPDRPGLVDEFTKVLYDSGGNLADSRMVNLRGQFAFIALVEGDDQIMDDLGDKAVAHGQSIGLHVTATSQSPPLPHPAGLNFRLKAYALDQPGIAHRIAHLLSEHGINIEELETRLMAGPYNGRPQFSISLMMTVPPTVQVKDLREKLSALCESLNCDYELHPG